MKLKNAIILSRFFVTIYLFVRYNYSIKTNEEVRILLLLLITTRVFSQEKKLDTVFCDCSQAKIINVNGKAIYGKTIAPRGFGKLNEISSVKQKSEFAFEKEHNSAWYKLNIIMSGELVVNITPTNASDDYDFMIFKSDKNYFCDSLQKHKIHPIRACISRDKEELSGKTGLMYNAKTEFVKHGVGEAYCKSITVKKGEIYYLVLDNVREKGGGHTVEFEVIKTYTFKGVVTSDDKSTIQADVALINQRGDTVKITKTDGRGNYDFTAPMSKNQQYDLHFYSDSSFFFIKKTSIEDTTSLKKLTTVLPKLKKGKKYTIGTINFIGGSVQYLSKSIPSMENLYRLLKKNSTLKIKIVGHSNGRQPGESDESNIAFTLGRANTIKTYLQNKGIDETRIQVEGKGDKEMLFSPNSFSEERQQQNRRVEVFVLDY